MQKAVPAQKGPIQWYLSPWKRFVLFEGRAGRPEFWWFILGQFITYLALFMLSGVVELLGFVLYAVLLAALLPTIAVTARRLHDIGQTGWLQLIGLIPFVGWVVVIVLCAMASKPGPNKYGPEALPPAA